MEPFGPLIESGPQAEYGQIMRDADLKGPLGDTRIWVDDVNSDGKLDILVGDMAPLISPADGISEGGSGSDSSTGGSRSPSRARRGGRQPATRKRGRRRSGVSRSFTSSGRNL